MEDEKVWQLPPAVMCSMFPIMSFIIPNMSMKPPDIPSIPKGETAPAYRNKEGTEIRDHILSHCNLKPSPWPQLFYHPPLKRGSLSPFSRPLAHSLIIPLAKLAVVQEKSSALVTTFQPFFGSQVHCSTITCILRLAGLVPGMLPSVMLRKGLYPKPPDNIRFIC